MARPKSLTTMSLKALLKLRDDVTETLGRQAAAMQEQLAALADLGTRKGRARNPLKKRKAAVKYRDRKGNRWSGRGAQPRWMTAAIKAGAKRDDFLVGNAAGKSTKRARSARKGKLAKKSSMKAKKAKRRIARLRAKGARPAKRPIARPEPGIAVSPAPANSSPL